MDGNRFDALTRAFGVGRTRRGVAKGLGAAALAAAGFGRLDRAEAAKGGNRACAAFCQSVFPPGSARGQCVSQATHGAGPCPACGANPANFCGGSCTDVATDPNNCGACGVVCPSGQCADGACVAAGGGGGVECSAGANVCEQGADPATMCHGSCYCFATMAGETVCAAGGDCFPCEVDADCDAQTGPGSFCVLQAGSTCGCGTVGNCQAPCPT